MLLCVYNSLLYGFPQEQTLRIKFLKVYQFGQQERSMLEVYVSSCLLPSEWGDSFRRNGVGGTVSESEREGLPQTRDEGEKEKHGEPNPDVGGTLRLNEKK